MQHGWDCDPAKPLSPGSPQTQQLPALLQDVAGPRCEVLRAASSPNSSPQATFLALPTFLLLLLLPCPARAPGGGVTTALTLPSKIKFPAKRHCQ